jgi:sterol desaturase/sphingolipid hydroxylase (fatty acid hydroxylase superfamily)
VKRLEILKDHIPEDYNPRWHVAACVASTVATAGLSLWKLTAIQPAHLLTFAGTLLVTNVGEYALHRWPFHNRWRGPAAGLYDRHTTMHHNLYDHETMPYESTRELKWVLLPAWGFPVVLAVLSPAAVVLYAVGPNHACMLLLATAAYYGVYEVLHTASHLPEDHWFGKLPFVRAASEHHRIHHNPRLMRRFNFNFAIPLFDKLFGTQYQADRAQADRAHEAREPAVEVTGDAAQRAR